MKKLEVKEKFIQLRAAGSSYREIAKKLHISKDTCGAWQKEFELQIAEAQRDRLEFMANEYGATKEGRIRRIGEMLSWCDLVFEQRANRIHDMPIEKIIDMRIKLQKELAAETSQSEPEKEKTKETIKTAFMGLLAQEKKIDPNAEEVKIHAAAFAALSKESQTTEPMGNTSNTTK